MPAEVKRQSDLEEDCYYVPQVAYLLLKYGVSIDFYHELSMVFDALPKSYKVHS